MIGRACGRPAPVAVPRWRFPVAALVAALLIASTGEGPARAEGVPLTARALPAPQRFALSLAGGTGASPQGHLGLRFAFAPGRLEAMIGVGVFVGADPRGENAIGKSPTEVTHVVPSLGVHYSVYRRTWFVLLPGLGLSVQPVDYQKQLTRPSYDTVQWTWRTSATLRLDADIEARVYVGDSWFASLVFGWAFVVAGASDDCQGETPRFMFRCENAPSPAYAPPTTILNVPYGQLVAGRRF